MVVFLNFILLLMNLHHHHSQVCIGLIHLREHVVLRKVLLLIGGFIVYSLSVLMMGRVLIIFILWRIETWLVIYFIFLR